MLMRFFTFVLSISLFCAALTLSAQISADGGAPIVLDAYFQRHMISAETPDQVVVLNNLIVGETYHFVIPDDPALIACRPTVSMLSPDATLTKDPDDLFGVKFTATSSSLTLMLSYPCSWSADDPPRHYVSAACITCKKTKLKDYLAAMDAVLEVGGASAEELIHEVLIGGDCFDVSGLTFSGFGDQIGTFSNGQTNIGIANGVIMATGGIGVAPGPNTVPNASAGYGVSTPDADLQQLSGSGAIFDKAEISFFFTPTQSPVLFEYVFASEEYCEYVNSAFNDAFGFFLSGPGINGPFGGAENIAQVGGAYVAINSINHLSNAGLYVNNQPADQNLCGQNPAMGVAVNEVQYDGFTRRLTAVAVVQPCQTYNIKLKVADVGDGIFDSAVFLRAGSFNAGGNVSVKFHVNGEPANEVYEACGQVQLIFSRVGGGTQSIPVQYTIGGTATPGVDYTPIPPIVVIPAGQQQTIVNITIFNDMILEGDETIIITLANPCSCLNPEEILIIKDRPQLDAIADTVSICGPSGIATVGVEVLDGVEPFSFQWSNGSNTQEITPFVPTSTNFRVTVTDGCGATVVRTARIIVNPIPIAQLFPPGPQLCPGGSAQIPMNFIGQGPFILTYAINGMEQFPVDVPGNPFSLTVNQPGLYQIVGLEDSLGCPGTGQGVVTVTMSNLAFNGTVNNVSCFGQNNGSINTATSGGISPYQYVWSGPVNIPNNIQNPNNLPAGVYNVTMTDSNNCSIVRTFTVTMPQALNTAIDSVAGVSCANPNSGGIFLDVGGGTPNYAYLWSNGASVQNPQNLTQGVYDVTITDANGCTATNSATVPGDFDAPDAVASVNGSLTCVVNSLQLSGAGSSQGQGITYNWIAQQGGNILSGGNTLNPVVNAAGMYILQVTNAANGCVSADTVMVSADAQSPVASAGPAQTFTCTVTEITLDGSGSSQGPNFTYNWTASQGGTILNGANTPNPQIGAPGQYTLTVANTNNGCTSVSSVNVNSNTTPPVAQIATPGQLTCVNTSISLNAGASTPAGGISFAWMTNNGIIVSGANTPNPVIAEPGTYTLVVTNTANGCTHSASVTVSQSADVPAAVVAPPAMLTCDVTSITLNGAGSASGQSITYSWSTVGGNIVGGGTTLTPTVNAPGSYTLLVVNNANNCSATSTVVVPEDTEAPDISAGPDQTLSCTNPTLQLQGVNNSAPGSFIYSWTASGGGNIVSGANTFTPVINASGVYQLTAVNTVNGCSSTASLNILADQDAPVAVIAQPATLTCATAQVIINATASTSGPTYVYQWTGPGIVSGATSATLVVDLPGIYTLLITNNANGCTDTESVQVGIDIAPPGADAGASVLLNCFNPQVSVGGAGNPTGPQYQFEWSGPGIVSGQNTPNPTVNQGGVYTLVVTNTTNGCTSQAQTTANTDFDPPLAEAGPGFLLTCVDNQYTMQSNVSQGTQYAYQWSSINGNFMGPTNVPNPTVNAPGVYVLTVTNTINGCTAQSSVTINQSADVPIVQIAPAATLTCATQQVQLNATQSSAGPSIQYQWTPPAGGGIVSGGATTTPVVNSPGIYTLLITDLSNNCTVIATVTVPIDVAEPQISAGPQQTLTCSNPALSLEGSVSGGIPFAALWTAGPGGNIQSGANTLTPLISAPGAYTLTVQNTANGCTSAQSVVVDVDQNPPVVSLQQPAILTCALTQTVINASASSAGASMEYVWTASAGGNIVDQSNPLQPIVDQPGAYTLLITNQQNGCTAQSGVTVTQDVALPNAQASVNGLLTCVVNQLDLIGTGSSAGPEFAYLWTTNNGQIIAGPTTLSPTVGATGQYVLQVTNTTNGCISTASVTVASDMQQPAVVIAQPGLLTCLNNQTTLNGAGSQVGPGISYSWTTPNGNIVSGQNSLTPVVNQTGAYTLLVTNANNGCTNSQTVQVNDNIVLPQADAGPSKRLTCSVNQVSLEATASIGSEFSYAWSTQNGLIVSGANTLTPNVSQPGTYQLLVTNTSTGCTQVSQVIVDVETNVPTGFEFDLKPPSCKDNDGVISFQSVQGGLGPYLYSIDNGASWFQKLEFDRITPGSYDLLIQDANGCEFYRKLVVPKAPDPAVDLIPEIKLGLGESAQLNAILPVGYPLALIQDVVWEPMDGLTFNGTDIASRLKPVAMPFRTTSYTVTVISNDDCKASDRVLIRVNNEPAIYIPNVFAPEKGANGNNRFYIFAKEGHVRQINHFQIFDRWGSMIYQAKNFQPNDPAYGWDGYDRGQALNPGVFVYYAEVELIDGRIMLFKGDVTLAR